MTKRDLVVASTRHHHARFLKYYPRRHCAPSLIKSRFFPYTANLLTVLTILHFEIPYMYTRGESWDASSGFGLWAKTLRGQKQYMIAWRYGISVLLFNWISQSGSLGSLARYRVEHWKRNFICIVLYVSRCQDDNWVVFSSIATSSSSGGS